ncbi:hypothetical protein [Nitrogeniibacter aestuarii]|uniref:hypothetical protein n=1 Tax=Nitrogeniibacter aestuarii TaxID=2815343 RepID=UPI001D128916|nr:hypothetical protein [Nitrogeniibacter aestuarii]
MTFANDRLKMLSALGVTLVVLAFVPGNLLKTLVLLGAWGVFFWPLQRKEAILFVAMSLLFVVMNYGALDRGVFFFTDPDFLLMPAFEFVMWGFYVLWLLRAVQPGVPAGSIRVPLALAVVFSLPFMLVPDHVLLLVLSGSVVLVGLILFHERDDLMCAGVMALLGAAIEYVGTGVGLWGYSNPPAGGVPFWFVTMWSGIGLLARRLVLPIMERGWKGAYTGIRFTPTGAGHD